MAPEGEPPAPRLFGTDGIRLVVGRELTPELLTKVVSALAAYLRGNGEVLLARDFRTTSEAIARVVSGGLLMQGIHVRDLGVMPTPCLQFNVRHLGATMGVTVTASHNPTEFNGLKLTGPEGLELPRDGEEFIERSIHTGDFPSGTWDHVGAYRADSDGIDRYLRSIVSHVDVEAVRRFAPTVVLDSGNGTSLLTGPPLLRELGCRVITLNANPDGYFSGRPSEPSEENLAELRRAVVEFGAAVGIAHDGDSDRIAFVDEQGRYIPGEVALAVFARARLKEHPHATIVTSITSSTAVADVVREMGGRLVETRSGSLPVARGVVESRAIFAGEENGGYYWPEHQVARDGPMSSAKMVELLAHERRPLSEIVAEMPTYTVLKTKVPLAQEALAARPIKEYVVREARRRLESGAQRLIDIDGIKAHYPDGWLLVRPSGTEPICRVFAESRDPARAKELLAQGVDLVQELLGEWKRHAPTG
ncbi:MAG TPA: phosphoglucosamine mutase [Thermoplasmata archaeon]|nr:phosphoglucosamine mutase [Thermoplasmata archaeon]